MIFLHQVFGKRLGGLQDGRALYGSEYPQASRLKSVRGSCCQGIVGTDDSQIDVLLPGECCQLLKIHAPDIDTLRHLGDPRVAGGAVQLVHFPALSHFPGNGVLSPAAAYDQYFHVLPPHSSLSAIVRRLCS